MTLVYEQATSQVSETDASVKTVLRELARAASIEVTPKQILGSTSWREWVPAGMAVYVPFLPDADFAHTVEACRQLRVAGMHPIPHLPARVIDNEGQLRTWLSSLAQNGTTSLLLIAGDSKHPGPFPDTMAVLESGLLMEYGFRNIGIAGHPEGHPKADQRELARALSVKRRYAETSNTNMWVVTQFSFEAGSIIQWLETCHEALAPLPVYLGIPGPTRLRTLMAFAAQCGVGVSAQMLRRKPGAARLLGSWTPDELVWTLAQYRLQNPQSALRGFHLFPFGGLERSTEWLRDLRRE